MADRIFLIDLRRKQNVVQESCHSLLLMCYINYKLKFSANGLDKIQIQIQLDFDTWILLDLDLVGYEHPVTLDLIELDSVG